MHEKEYMWSIDFVKLHDIYKKEKSRSYYDSFRMSGSAIAFRNIGVLLDVYSTTEITTSLLFI